MSFEHRGVLGATVRERHLSGGWGSDSRQVGGVRRKSSLSSKKMFVVRGEKSAFASGIRGVLTYRDIKTIQDDLNAHGVPVDWTTMIYWKKAQVIEYFKTRGDEQPCIETVSGLPMLFAKRQTQEHDLSELEPSAQPSDRIA